MRQLYFRLIFNKRHQHQDRQNDFNFVEHLKNDAPNPERERNRHIRRLKFERRFQKRDAAEQPEPDKRNRDLQNTKKHFFILPQKDADFVRIFKIYREIS